MALATGTTGAVAGDARQASTKTTDAIGLGIDASTLENQLSTTTQVCSFKPISSEKSTIGATPDIAPPSSGPSCLNKLADDEDHEEPHTDGESAPPSTASTPLIPPYWSHRRAASCASTLSNAVAPIRLEDHTLDEEGQKSPLWAKVVDVDSYVVVSGNVKGVGDYVVWNCRVERLEVSDTSLAAMSGEGRKGGRLEGWKAGVSEDWQEQCYQMRAQWEARFRQKRITGFRNSKCLHRTGWLHGHSQTVRVFTQHLHLD